MNFCKVDLKKSSQYLVVDSSKKIMYLYENEQFVKQFAVVLGKNGVSKEKREGDLCTPLGDFNLGFAFGTEDISISYPYYKITPSVYWVSDSDSIYYNEWVFLGDEREYPYEYMKTASSISWSDAEHLIDYTIPYQFGLVIEYNMNPKVKNMGSAIFLHVKNNDYTEGCVAVSKEDMKFILHWLKNEPARIAIF